MGQMSNNVTEKDVQIMPRKEECASGTGQRSRLNYAAARDAQRLL